jgi:hypothetical protein
MAHYHVFTVPPNEDILGAVKHYVKSKGIKAAFMASYRAAVDAF